MPLERMLMRAVSPDKRLTLRGLYDQAYKHKQEFRSEFWICVGEQRHTPSSINSVRFQVLPATTMETTEFQKQTPCNIVEICRNFRRTCSFNIQGNIHKKQVNCFDWVLIKRLYEFLHLKTLNTWKKDFLQTLTVGLLTF